MNPKQFLLWGGVVLLALGVLGLILPGGRIIGETWFLTPGENWAHLVLGIVAIVASYTLGAPAQRTLTGIVGVVALIFGVWGFFLDGRPRNFYGLANLELLDNIVHLVVAVWAYLSMRGRGMAAAGM